MSEKKWRKAENSEWRPEQPGEQVTGFVVDVREAETQYGPRRIADLRTAGGSIVSVWIARQSLIWQWDALNPQPGEEVRITYSGQKTGKNGNAFHNYVVEVAEGDPASPSAATGTDDVPF